MAEAIARKYFPFEVSSAGTKVPTNGPGREGKYLKDIPVAEPVIRCLKEEENIDVSHYKNKQLKPEILKGADKIIIMAEKETLPDLLKEFGNTEYWDVKDPLHHPYEFYCKTLEQIKTKVFKLLSETEL